MPPESKVFCCQKGAVWSNTTSNAILPNLCLLQFFLLLPSSHFEHWVAYLFVAPCSQLAKHYAIFPKPLFRFTKQHIVLNFTWNKIRYNIQNHYWDTAKWCYLNISWGHSKTKACTNFAAGKQNTTAAVLFSFQNDVFFCRWCNLECAMSIDLKLYASKALSFASDFETVPTSHASVSPSS